jgi:solute carrier family 25 phosphate transporter 3
MHMTKQLLATAMLLAISFAQSLAFVVHVPACLRPAQHSQGRHRAAVGEFLGGRLVTHLAGRGIHGDRGATIHVLPGSLFGLHGRVCHSINGVLAAGGMKGSRRGSATARVGRTKMGESGAGAGTSAGNLDMMKYPKLFFAGGLCATITHAVTVPIDLVKTSQQIHPGIYSSLPDGLGQIYAANGVQGLFLGIGPTAVGFLLQGALKYGCYDLIKDTLEERWGSEQQQQGRGRGKEEEEEEKEKEKRDPLLVSAKTRVAHPVGGGLGKVARTAASGAMAEVMGTLALLPFEATRIRMIAEGGTGSNMWSTLSAEVAASGVEGLYSAIVPIMFKQVPFTVAQFLVYEALATAAYASVAKSSEGGEEESGAAKYGTLITVGCGICAGVAASLISQPGDSVLSVMTSTPGATLWGTFTSLGPAGLFIGADTRVVHVTSFITVQFLIYDTIKRFFGIKVAGADAATAK